MQTVSLKAENLIKIFYDKKNKKEIHAVDGVSFSIPSGDIFGFLGPNGAGKTTTVRLLVGLLKPTSGKAELLGEDVSIAGDRIRKRVGFLTENHGSYENLTVYDNLRFFGSFYDIPDLEYRIDEILEELEIKDRKKMKVGKLSKGLKQRTALARVLLHEPKILFLDEPTSGLDPKAASDVRNIIKGLKNKERTIFINSHNLDEVQKICDQVAILNYGKIKRMGTASELSKDIFGSQELSIKIKLPQGMHDPDNIKEKIRKTLEDVKELKHFEIQKPRSGANVSLLNGESSGADIYNGLSEKIKILIHLDEPERTTPQIVKNLVQNKFDILEVYKTSHSLEEIYLKLMEESEGAD